VALDAVAGAVLGGVAALAYLRALLRERGAQLA
jgi:hypothetical protein